MASIVLPGPSLLFVKWGCRRCGYRQGIARTTVPLVDGMGNQEEIMQLLFSELRKKLVMKHLKHGCVATIDDFTFESWVPQGQTLLDKV